MLYFQPMHFDKNKDTIKQKFFIIYLNYYKYFGFIVIPP